MTSETCPICDGALESRRVAPCMSCGGDPEEVDHHLTGLHGFAEYELFDGMRLILCNYCALDFPSQDPVLFGLDRPLRREDLRLVRRLERPHIEEDAWCTSCNRRLSFLRFAASARERHGAAS